MKCRLLVEGVDEVEVISHLMSFRGFKRFVERDQVPAHTVATLRHMNGRELHLFNARSRQAVLESISVTWKSPDWPHNLGAVVDWEYEIEGQTKPWPSVRARILKAIPEGTQGLPMEIDEPPEAGVLVSDDSGRRLGAWIMPDNRVKGALETLMLSHIKPGDLLLPRAKSAVDGIPKDERPFKHKIDKAYIHTWLAWQEEPGLRMGSAIRANYLDPESPGTLPFVRWIEALLDET